MSAKSATYGCTVHRRINSRELRDLRGESDAPPPLGEGGDALVGELIAERYRVVRKLGEGSQASVYVAKHTLIKRFVALKILQPATTADRDLVRRFLDEGQVAGTIGHPNIVESLDMGATEDGRPYLVLEYLEGTTLGAELAVAGAFDVGRAAYVALQIASALGAAHQRGIVHRDLKPENVFLVVREGRPDHVKVIDFGISKFQNRTDADPGSGLVFGTPDYMAPEQVTNPSTVDGRADVFALGAILYEMLSGRPPLDVNASTDVLDAIVHQVPVPLGNLRPGLPAPLVAAVERALHKDRSKRFERVAELRAVLAPFATPSTAAPLSARESRISEIAPQLPLTSEPPQPTEAPSVPAARRTLPVPGSVPHQAPHQVPLDRESQTRARVMAADAAPARSSKAPIAVAALIGVVVLAAAGTLLFLRGRGAHAHAQTEPTASAAFVAATTAPSAALSWRALANPLVAAGLASRRRAQRTQAEKTP